jgi:hypothetical protein
MRVRDVSVHIEHVSSMPHGAKLFIDEPPGEDLVVWVLGGRVDGDVVDAIDRYLFAKGQPSLGPRFEDGRQFAS